MFKLGLEKAGGTRDQTANIHWVIEKAREFYKNICFIDYEKGFGYADHNKPWKILKRDRNTRLSYLCLQSLYAGQEAIVRIRRGTTDWFKIGHKIGV